MAKAVTAIAIPYTRHSLELKPYNESQFGVKNAMEFSDFLGGLFSAIKILPQWSFKNAFIYCEAVDGLKGRLKPQNNLDKSFPVMSKQFAESKLNPPHAG